MGSSESVPPGLAVSSPTESSPPALDLENIASLCTQGDKNAFADLFRHLHQPLYRFVFLKAKSSEIAKDICSETFITFWRYRSRYKLGNIKAFLFTIARNKIIDYFRKEQKVIPVEQIELISNDEDSLEISIEKKEQVGLLVAAIGELPAQFAEVVQLRYIEEYSIKEAAEMLGMTSSNVRTTSHRALQKLKEILNGR